jgi:ubiquitin-conjugating enzyme (huntingtin interacting protein 2)
MFGLESSWLKRVVKELVDLEHSSYNVQPYHNNNADLSHLEASLPIPSGTPYSGGTYTIDIRIPASYLFEKPAMKFNAKIWHPNVHQGTV